MAEEFKYKAFISYSHSDEKWASWLHRSLETYKVPKPIVGNETAMGEIPARLAPVFRDRDELPSATNLGELLTQSLADSGTQVVICSPAAANSHWVNEEILTYKRLGRSNRIFCLIVGGEPWASDKPGQEEQECFPPALRFEMGDDGVLSDVRAEPIAADARPEGDGKPNAKLKLVSGMLGVGFDALKQREAHRRHQRMLVFTTSAFVGMAITSGLAVTAYVARIEAEEQRNRAQVEAETARQTTNFMVDLFKVSDPSEALGNTITAREILDKGAERIDTELTDQPEIQATLMDTMGTVYTSLGLYGDAAPLIQKAVNKRRALFGNESPDVASSLNELGKVQTLNADYEEAESNLREALSLRRKLYGDDHPFVARTLADLALVLSEKGEFVAAEALIVESLAIRRSLHSDSHPDVAESLEDLGLNYYDQGDYEKAVEYLSAALEMRRELHDGPLPVTSEAIANLAFVLHEMSNYEAAERLYRESLAMDRLLLGDKHPELSTSMNNLAWVLYDKGDLDGAESLYRQVIDMDRELLGDEHPQLAQSLNNLAFVLHDKGNIEGAIALEREAVAIYESVYGDQHPALAGALSTLGFMLTRANLYTDAEPILLRSLEMRRALLEADNPRIGRSLLTLAQLYIATGRYEEAATNAKTAYDSFDLKLGQNHWLTGAAIAALGSAELGLEQFDDAEKHLLAGYETMKRDGGAMPVVVDEVLRRLIELYRSQGQEDKAAIYYLASIK